MKLFLLIISFIVFSFNIAYAQGLIIIHEPVNKEVQEKKRTSSSSGYSQGFGISKKSKKKPKKKKVDPPFWVVPAKSVISCYYSSTKQSVTCTFIGTSQSPAPYFFRSEMKREDAIGFIKKVLDTNRTELLEIRPVEVNSYAK